MILRVKYNYPWKSRKRMKIFYSFMFYGCRLGRRLVCPIVWLSHSLSPRLTFGLSIAHHFNCLYISQVKWKKWMKPSIEKWAWGIRTDVNPNGSDNRQNWWTWGDQKHMNTYVCVYILRVMVARGTLPGTKISMAPHALDISQVLCGIYGMRHKWMDDNV